MAVAVPLPFSNKYDGSPAKAIMSSVISVTTISFMSKSIASVLVDPNAKLFVYISTNGTTVLVDPLYTKLEFNVCVNVPSTQPLVVDEYVSDGQPK